MPSADPASSLSPLYKKIGVAGLGNWGTALANAIAERGSDVTGWSIEEDVVRAVNDRRENCRYLAGHQLSERFRATTSISELQSCDLVLLVVPSKALVEVFDNLQANKGQTFVSAIKGFVGESRQTPLDFLHSRGITPDRTAVISGPSFAIDVIRGKPCGLVCASASHEQAQKLSEFFKSSSMKFYPSQDVRGVELGGILKNVIALAAGVSDGLGLGDSARAGLITRGLAEMVRLAEAMGAKRETLFGLSGLGDLLMTCSSDTSRNRTVGLRLGSGEKLSEITSTLGSVAEGVRTAPYVLELAKEQKVDVPIAEQVVRLVRGETSAREMAAALLNRPVRAEF